MSVVQTILVFVVIPGAVVGVMALLIWGSGAARTPRYRAGRNWPYEPVWYAPHPLAVLDPVDDDSPVRSQLTAGTSTTPSPPGIGPTAAGGARGTW